MRPLHHVQPLTNPPGHAQEPHERYRCKTTAKSTAATDQPATETALEGAQEQVKLLDWEPAQDVYLLWAFFHFSDEAVKGAQHMRSNLEAAMACLGQASVSLGAPPMPTNLLHHGSQNRIQKTSRNMAARKGPRLYCVTQSLRVLSQVLVQVISPRPKEIAVYRTVYEHGECTVGRLVLSRPHAGSSSMEI